jgi:hypothetical protein
MTDKATPNSIEWQSRRAPLPVETARALIAAEVAALMLAATPSLAPDMPQIMQNASDSITRLLNLCYLWSVTPRDLIDLLLRALVVGLTDDDAIPDEYKRNP